ncbi:Translation initiation factor 2 [hydrothermal vent metagenome]|uniref:Translation initiation factor 2 n=1 Tax=hydrothermal vent metagenome TaxID=652676 RepID=A0A3B1CAS0_9ZZZZ
MSGIRVHELSQETGVSSKDLIDLITKMGYPVKSHSSTVDYGVADRVRRQIKKMDLPVKKPKKAKAKPVEKKPVAKAKTATKKPADKPKTVPAKKPVVKAKVVTKKPEEEPIKAVVAEKPEPKKMPVSEKAPEPKTVTPNPEEVEKARVAYEAKRREEQARRKKATEEAQKRREAEEKKRAADAKRRKEGEAKRKNDAEKRKIRQAEDGERRKKAEEERELQRLMEEEDREKREAEAKRIVIDEATTVKEFAEKLRMGANEIIVKLIGKGMMATLNQTIDAAVAKELAVEMGYEIKTREEEEVETAPEEVEDKSKLRLRHPVVTIMGHVDHGKTSLLDTIRKTRVTEEEAGGITQKIGAYKVDVAGGSVVFLDTPGHEAFTAMRSRGAAFTDIVVLVVAADDGVMPQTVEAIHHAKAAQAPILVAVNKMDKPGANPEKIKQELTAHELVAEEWGGETIFCGVSAKTGEGIDHLLEMLLLQAEVLELKADPERLAFGAVIESKLDRGRGPVATVLVQKGTLKIGDPFVSGPHFGKVRALIDDTGARIKQAEPSTPVEVLGFNGVPNAGDTFMAVESERKAHQIALTRENAERLEGLVAKGHVRLDNLHAQITKGEIKELNIIIKADVQGSIEAVSKAFDDIKMEDVRIRVLHGAVGGITETDVNLAAASNAIIIGFNIRPTEKARTLAEEEAVDIRLYSIIYNAIDDVKAALEGMLEPVFEEKITGRAEVRDAFHIKRIGTIAGCMVSSGKIVRGSDARLIRDDMVIYTGKVSSLRRFKDDAKEVASGYECGIGLEKYNDIKVSDVIETFSMEETEASKARAGAQQKVGSS